MQIISEENIKDILRNHDVKMNTINQKMEELTKEIETTDALLDALKLNVGEKVYGKDEGIGKVTTKYSKHLEQHSKDLQTIFDMLMEEKQVIQRVWNCFYALDEPYYTILYMLYVEQRLYKTVEAEYKWSHRVFERDRKKGISLIQQIYINMYDDEKQKLINSG